MAAGIAEGLKRRNAGSIFNRAVWDGIYESVDHIVTSDYEAILSGIQFFGPRFYWAAILTGNDTDAEETKFIPGRYYENKGWEEAALAKKYNLLYGLVIDG